MTTKNKVEIERLSHSDNLGRLRQKKTPAYNSALALGSYAPLRRKYLLLLK